MAYTKTNWNESTPITADKLNKIEDGIASALPLTGGTLTGNLVFSKVGGGGLNASIANSTLEANTGNGQMMNVGSGNIIYVGNPNTPLMLESNVNPTINIGGNQYSLYHTGNKPTANDVGALPIGGGTLTGPLSISGNSKNIKLGTGGSDVYIHNTASGKYLQLKDSGAMSYTGNWLLAHGTALCGNISGDAENRRIATIASHGGVDLGDTVSETAICSKSAPTWWNGSNGYKIYTEGNKPTAGDIGALPLSGGTVSGETVFTNYLSVKAWSGYGTGTAQMWYDGNTKLLNIQNAAGLKAGNHLIARWEGSNPTHNMFRYGSGLGGANGYITFSY